MESRINYTVVGVFVCLLLAAMIGFVYWLGKYGYQQEYDFYYVHMMESVSGLSPEASVKYRGVDVGIVEKIRLNPENSEEVELLLKLKRGTRIKIDTRATIRSFGITGLAFVDLTGGDKDAAPLTGNGKIPVIPAAPSTYARLDESLTILAAKLTLGLDRTEQLLSERNLHNLSEILEEIKGLTRDVRGQIPAWQRVADSSVAMEKEMTRAFARVESAAAGVEKMAGSLEHDYRDPDGATVGLIRRNLTSLNQLLSELEILVGDLQRTTRSIEASPGDLLFKRSQVRPGPGEEGYDAR
jgi:phospholipid/cholesterol/gamma-HCH transport system substrate-binding protein